MLMLGFQLIIRVLALDVFPESDRYTDVVLIVLQVVKNTFLGYLEVDA
jgi:hypothetical protein